jgi:hypothetical protein
VPSGGQNGIRPEGLSTAVELHPTLRYDEKREVFVRISDGTVFHDNGRGSFVGARRPHTPYRAFLDPATFRRKENVQLVAVELALDGSTSLSSVGAFAFR